ncbi:MAG: HDIG domain-containing protein [Phormidesmis sp. RL_2_1]|nr:HDIG domain-containing protein [Phormidesmis sp. RL_2_1]
MGVLRRFASRVYQVCFQLFSRLKHPGYYLRRFNRSCAPWVNGAQRFFLIEGVSQSLAVDDSPGRSQGKGRLPGRLHGGVKRSTGQNLVSLKVYKRTWLVTVLALVLLTTCLGQRFYNQPGLDVRAVSPQTFFAPKSAVFEDKKATENLRNNVRDGSVQVLKIDNDLTAEAAQSLKTLLAQGRELREKAGGPPFLQEDTLSKLTQDFLFQSSDAEWQTVWRLAQLSTLSSSQLPLRPNSSANPLNASPNTSAATNPAAVGSPNQPPVDSTNTPDNRSENSTGAAPSNLSLMPLLETQVRSLTPQQSAALKELVAYREKSGEQGLELLQIRVDTRRRHYRKATEELASQATTTNGQLIYNYRLFELSDEQWLILENNAKQVFSEMMLQGVHPGVPPDLLRRAIEAQVPAGPTPEIRQLTVDVLAAVIAPNLVLDDERTKLRAEQAVNQIAPVMISIQKGALIVRAGEVIDEEAFALLDHFDLTSRYFNWIGLCGYSILVAGAMALYFWVDHHQLNQLNQRDHLLVLMLCLVVPILAALRVPTIGLPAVGLLVGSFYGGMLGITVVGLLVLVLPIGTPVTMIPLLAGAAAALLGAWISPQLRSREEFALLGGFVGLAQASVHLVLTLMSSTVAAPLWKSIFIGSAMYGLYGIVWSVAALGVSPYLEHFFDVVTPIRLAELSNPNRALLKRLSAEAPGTFQHTMFVANLAEAAARALGRNVELVRAGTLYHDIGKMHDPQGFIENQMDGPNKHDLIDDPWESARIIKKHVTQGLVMARKYRLPKAVQAFIPEHQGDMKISYFYQQAKARQVEEPSLVINEADFSYDGPIPQTPETGITMLADSCEAALRSLKPEASMDEAYTMVDKILRARWRNRQLVDSGLSRADMDVIASVFIQVWQQHNHKRISYPKNILAGQEA